MRIVLQALAQCNEVAGAVQMIDFMSIGHEVDTGPRHQIKADLAARWAKDPADGAVYVMSTYLQHFPRRNWQRFGLF